MRVAIVVSIALTSFVTAGLPAAEPGSRDAQQTVRRALDLLPGKYDWGHNLSGPLCGVYAACTALELLGIKADPRDFIASQYVSDCGGSSPQEIARVITDAGAKAHVLTRLSAFDLRLIDCPIIANVRISPTSNRFNHWVVAIASDDGVTIYDGLQKPYEVRTAEFLGSWSGIGVCVTRNESSPLLLIWLGRSSLFLTIGIVGVFAWTNPSAVARVMGSSGLKQHCVLCVGSFVLAFAGNLVFGDLSNHSRGVAVATASNGGHKYRMGTLKEANAASASRNALLVDARRQEDYRLGTIEGAVNVPVTASTWAIHTYLEKLDRRTPIVVFCQSARCHYDETIAAQIASLGFADVAVCDEGWSEYRKAAQAANQ